MEKNPIDQSKGSYPDWTSYKKIDDNYSTLEGDGLDQLMVYRKPVSDDEFSRWLGEIQDQLRAENMDTDLQIVSMCGNCDNSLLLFTGKGAANFISTDAARSGNSNPAKSGVQGQSHAAYYCSNLKFQLPKQLLETNEKGGRTCDYKSSGSAPVKVAVFDTGLVRQEVDLFIAPAFDSPCIREATRGWNFTVPNNEWDDDNPGQHGSTVTRFIIEEVVQQNGQSVEIIPVKVHNSEGKSDLYSILCGFAYAKSMGAKIINASFGYYAPIRDANDQSKDFCLTVFRKFIQDQLTDNNILLVAAAGNLPSDNEIAEIKQVYPSLNPESRDLSIVGFYPASFAGEAELTNVIAVTSVNPGCTEVSPTQNFSSSVVDIGVQSDDAAKSEFINPRTGTLIGGSSFATPIVTGFIASNYTLFGNTLTKSNIINTLRQQNGLPHLEPVPGLAAKIKDGMVLKRKN